MHFTSITASAAVLLSCTAAVMAQRCNPVTQLNGDDSITVTGLGSTPDYTIAIEQDGTPISTEFLREFCSVVATACSEATGDELEQEIAFCIADSEEFISYTMAELEDMVDYSQEVAGEEELERQQMQEELNEMMEEEEEEAAAAAVDLDVDAEEVDLELDDQVDPRVGPDTFGSIDV